MMLLEGSNAAVESLAFSADSFVLAAGFRDGSARIWDASGGLIQALPPMEDKPVWSVAISPTCDRVATTHGESTRLHELDLKVLRSVAHPILSPGSALRFLNNDTLVVGMGQKDKRLPGGYFLYDITKNQMRRPIQNETHGVRALEVDRDNKLIAWITGNQLLRWANITKPGHQEVRLGVSALDLAIHPRLGVIALSIDWDIKVIDMHQKLIRREFRAHKGQVRGLTFTADGRYLVSTGWDETIRFWDTNNWQEVNNFNWKIGRLQSLACSPDGTRMAVGSDRGLIAIWDTE